MKIEAWTGPGGSWGRPWESLWPPKPPGTAKRSQMAKIVPPWVPIWSPFGSHFSWFWDTFFRWNLWWFPGSLFLWFWHHFTFLLEVLGIPFFHDFFENVEKVRFDVLPAREHRKSMSRRVQGSPFGLLFPMFFQGRFQDSFFIDLWLDLSSILELFWRLNRKKIITKKTLKKHLQTSHARGKKGHAVDAGNLPVLP